MNEDFHEKKGKESIMTQIISYSCPADCSQKGKCTNGTCVCESNFVGADCSVDIRIPPVVSDINDGEGCDLLSDPCDEVTVNANFFVIGPDVTCKLRQMYVRKNIFLGQKLKSVIANVQNTVEAFCPVPRRNYKTPRHGHPGIDSIRIIHISVSNDGRTFSKEHIVVIHNSQCESCHIDGKKVTCSVTKNHCTAEGKCYQQRSRHRKTGLVCYSVRGIMVWLHDATFTCREVKTGSGIHMINMPYRKLVLAQCDMKTDGGGWLIFFRRVNADVSFNRSWSSYKNGFGKLSKSFWWGNENLHLFTSAKNIEMRVDITDQKDQQKYAKYSNFYVDSEEQLYRIHVSGYSGTASDPFSNGKLSQNGMSFTTYDRDNDNSDGNCAQTHAGGFWFNGCGFANPTGKYVTSANMMSVSSMAWFGVKQTSLVKHIVMSVKPSSKQSA